MRITPFWTHPIPSLMMTSAAPVDSKQLLQAKLRQRAGRWLLRADLRRLVLVDNRWLHGALVRLDGKMLLRDIHPTDGSWHRLEPDPWGSRSLRGALDPLGGMKHQPAIDLPDGMRLRLEFARLGGRWLRLEVDLPGGRWHLLATVGEDSWTAHYGHWWPLSADIHRRNQIHQWSYYVLYRLCCVLRHSSGNHLNWNWHQDWLLLLDDMGSGDSCCCAFGWQPNS